MPPLHQANLSMKLRADMLAGSRPETREYELGEWAYYGRTAGDSTLEKWHWQ